ncbi:hypothetical protein J4E89_010049 [Alternaria sp. Ai002NY15]|nr:hypothetical protein J4E89_010049 [Alternaria sp. Ai002NY15]
MATKLTTSLITEYEQAINLESLPRSFKDAIEITRVLGYQYLWIDALCILQDNADDWEKEAPMMASYYGLSSLMISATAARNSHEGFLKRRNVIFSPGLGDKKSFYLRYGVIRPDADIAASILSTRGWAAQERMLAPRVLHYTQRQMIWECTNGMVSEASGIQVMDYPPIPRHFPALRKRRLQCFFEEALSVASNHFPTSERAPKNDVQLLLQAWHECIDEYSVRDLTMPSDKLHAVAGIATLLNKYSEMGHYLAGIWSTRLADNLAWRKHKGYLSHPENYRAPSWSWASLDGRVRFHGPQRSGVCHALSSETMEKRAKLFGLNLKEHHMVLKDDRNIYGAVLEGSYIVVNGACIAYKALDRLLDRMAVNPNAHRLSLTDSTNADLAIDELDSRSQEYKAPLRRLYVDDVDDEHHTPALQFCMYVRGSGGDIEVLLLEWLDQAKRAARRVGLMQLTEYEGEYFDHFKEGIHTDDWQRWTVKLV